MKEEYEFDFDEILDEFRNGKKLTLTKLGFQIRYVIRSTSIFSSYKLQY